MRAPAISAPAIPAALVLLLGVAAAAAAPGPQRGPEAATDAAALAFVTELAGRAAITTADGDGPLAVRRHDWLPEGSTLAVAPASRAVVVLFSGERLSLGPGASGRITGRGLVDREGDVERLPPVAPLPRVPPPARAEREAVRVCGEGLQLYPAGGARTLASDTVLRFGSDARLGDYRVVLTTARGKELLARATGEPILVVPPDVLAPGERYRFEVRARDATGIEHAAASEFTTLTRDEEGLRHGLRQLMPERDAATLRYLAEVDRGLGLLWEHLDGAKAALELSVVCPDAVLVLPERARRPCHLPEIPPTPPRGG